MLHSLIALAWAADEPSEFRERNLSATTLGTQYWYSSALRDLPDTKSSDVDFLVGQRLRWTMVDKDRFQLRARVRARFTLSPGDDGRTGNGPGGNAFWARNRVQELGLSAMTPKWTLDIGRHPVFRGGPRLVDGLQFRYHASRVLDIGVWGGSAPDLYTTDPRFGRLGGGPIVALTASRYQLSAVGEFTTAEGGLDRAAVLLQGRLSAARTIEISGRADIELASIDGGVRLSDAQVFTRWSPFNALTVDATYNIFSSFQYQQTQDLDPDLTRFAARYLANDARLPALIQDCAAPEAAHLLGASVRYQPRKDGTVPIAGALGRYRFGPDVDIPPPGAEPKCVLDDVNEFIRVNPWVGVNGIPFAGRLDVRVDGNYYAIEGRSQMDAGVSLFWEPGEDGVLAIDTSYRMLLNDYDADENPFGYRKLAADGGEGTIGHYADLFVDGIIVPIGLSVGGGVSVVSEPNDIATDMGLGAFLRMTKYVRGKRAD